MDRHTCFRRYRSRSTRLSLALRARLSPRSGSGASDHVADPRFSVRTPRCRREASLLMSREPQAPDPSPVTASRTIRRWPSAERPPGRRHPRIRGCGSERINAPDAYRREHELKIATSRVGDTNSGRASGIAVFAADRPLESSAQSLAKKRLIAPDIAEALGFLRPGSPCLRG
jgi:hypothetical protein